MNPNDMGYGNADTNSSDSTPSLSRSISKSGAVIALSAINGIGQNPEPEPVSDTSSSRKSNSSRIKDANSSTKRYHTRSQSQSKSHNNYDLDVVNENNSRQSGATPLKHGISISSADRGGMISAPGSPAPMDLTRKKRSSRPDLTREDSILAEYYNNYMEKGGESLSNLTRNIKGLFSGSLSNLSSAAQSFVASAGPAAAASGFHSSFGSGGGGPGTALGLSRRSSGSLSSGTGNILIPGSSLPFNTGHRDSIGAGGGQSIFADNYKTLLVIDERHTDWSKYFRSQTLNQDWDLRLEQAEFREINLASYSDTGTVVDMQIIKGGTRVIRSFKPEFVLVRQYVKDVRDDWKNILLGFIYGNVPSINSFESIYNFYDKPRVFSELIKIQKRLGKDQFPLIEQAFYPNHKEMMITPKFPIVVKIGHYHNGSGKVKIDNHYDFQDITSIIGVTQSYSTIEPFIDSKYDIHVQKIGSDYKAFMRKSISGNWKANMGSSILEEISVNEKYKLWVDECSKLFGGLDILAVEAIKSKDGKEYIIGVNGSAMNLLGESQEEDRKLIAQLTLNKMEASCAAAKDKHEESVMNKIEKSENQSTGMTDTMMPLPLLSAHSNISKQSNSFGPVPGQVQIPSSVSSNEVRIEIGNRTSMRKPPDIHERETISTGASRGKLFPTPPPSMPPPPIIPPHPLGVGAITSISTSQQPPLTGLVTNGYLQNQHQISSNTPASRYPGQSQNSPKNLISQQNHQKSQNQNTIRNSMATTGTEQKREKSLVDMSSENGPSHLSKKSMKKTSQGQVHSNRGIISSNQTDLSSLNSLVSLDDYSSYHNDNSSPGIMNAAKSSLAPTTGGDKDIVGDTMGNLRKTFAGIFGDL